MRRGDLLTDPVPERAFDLAHARLLLMHLPSRLDALRRLVLMHLPSRLDALRRLVSAVRPGGWIAIIDVDFTSVELAPRSLAWERAWSAFCDALVAAGWGVRYGARLCTDLRALELADVEADYVSSRERGGPLAARLLSLTLERLREQMLAVGAAGEDLDRARGLLEDSATDFRSQTTRLARARRSSSPG